MKGTRNLWISIAFVAILVLTSVAGFVTGLRPLLGLDLKGGLSVILTAPSGTPKDVMNQAADNIRNRVDALGVSDAQISVSGTNIQVEIASTGKGKVAQVAKEQYCLIGLAQRSFGCTTKQTVAQTTLSGISVQDLVAQVCLNGKGGTNYGCFTSRKDANAALKAMSVQKQGGQYCVTENATPSSSKAKATPAPTPSPTPAPTPSGGTSLPCEKTQKAAQAQLAALTTKVTQQKFCLVGKGGSSLACYTSQSDANTALAGIKAVHETTQYCVTGPDGKSLGCFVNQNEAQDTLNATGQQHILATIGQTARLEERQVTAPANGVPNPIPPSDPHYGTTPLTCPNGSSAPGCSYDALKNKPVVYAGTSTSGSKPLKYQLGPVLVPGSDIAKATAVYQTASGSSLSAPTQIGWQVNFTLTPAGSKNFGDVTTRLVNQQLAIVLDQKVISAPTVNQPITNGSGVITGNFSEQRSKDLATVLNAGALPVDLTRNQVQTISPTLGAESLHQGLIAGIAGLIALAIYLAFYYRLLGVVTWLGMSIWAAFAIALIALAGQTIGYSLSLAGIAGVIVSMGITADSYIVFYERLKDEVRHGKTPRSAIAPAFKRAWRTIVAADTVTILAAAVLYVLAIGSVRGFALTLGLATALDLFVVYFFKRPTVFLIARSPRLTSMRGFGLTSGVAVEAEPAPVAGGST